jgi:Protein of unknown function (DUF3467)
MGLLAILPTLGSVLANFANVTSTQREVFVDFCLVSPPHDIDTESRLIQAPVIVRIIASPEFARSLQEAITAHLVKAEQRQKASKTK